MIQNIINNDDNKSSQNLNTIQTPRIITVVGENQRGKTTLIKHLYEILKQLGAEQLFFKLTGAYFEDFYAVVFWNGKKIAICSIGDKSYDNDVIEATDNITNNNIIYIQRGLILAKNYKADILVNTLSVPTPQDKTKHETLDEYEKLLMNSFSSSVFIPINLEYIKPGDYTPIKTKQEKCNEIIDEIKK